MLEKSNLPDETIITVLRESYAIPIAGIDFLPLGNDSAGWVYEARAEDGRRYFLKVKRDTVYPPGVFVPRYLNDQGLEQAVAPLPTRAGKLWVDIDDFALILYPFIDGRPGMETGLTDSQWIELGAALKQIHATKLPPDLLALVDKEAFAPQWNGRVQGREAVRRIADRIAAGGFEGVHEGAFAAFWHEHRAQIARLMDRAEELSRLLQKQPADYVLCHTDVHTANVLLDDTGRMHIVDWDMPVMAFKERDLMFLVGGVIGGDVVRNKETLFFQGYGETDVDPLALAYYRYEWAVQDICDYAERVFVMDGVGDETKAAAVAGFISIFQPGDEVDAAFGSEADLSPEYK